MSTLYQFYLVLQLTAVNDKMAEYTNTPGASSHNAALMHTLQRHRDILQVNTIISLCLLTFHDETGFGSICRSFLVFFIF